MGLHKPKKLNALSVEHAKYRPVFSASGKQKGNELRHERGLYLYISANNVKSWRYQ
jgi:hypothetical protein